MTEFEETFGSGIFLRSSESVAAGRNLPGFHFSFARSQPGLRLEANEIEFRCFGENVRDAFHGFSGRPPRGPNVRRHYRQVLRTHSVPKRS
jgi:hypothetical protein